MVVFELEPDGGDAEDGRQAGRDGRSDEDGERKLTAGSEWVVLRCRGGRVCCAVEALRGPSCRLSEHVAARRRGGGDGRR